MGFLRRKPDTLAIIGNGFDLAHGYRTDYRSFAERTDSECLERFKSYCRLADIETWYLFEENIRLITEALFHLSMTEDCDYEDNRRQTEELAGIFREIQKLLLDYLAGETAGRPLRRKRSIEEQLGPNAAAINFNYTDTAEAYIKKVFYVHGSLAEGDILLGYDHRDEPCLAQFEDMQWSKDICREALAFRRRFLRRKRLPPGGKKYRELLDGLQAVQHWENSGRGLEDEMRNIIPRYRTVCRFLKRHRARPFPALDYRAIRSLVVLGHGIEADRAYLTELLNRCAGLERVTIFRYDGEPEESWQNKRAFFTPYCETVVQTHY